MDAVATARISAAMVPNSGITYAPNNSIFSVPAGNDTVTAFPSITASSHSWSSTKTRKISLM